MKRHNLLTTAASCALGHDGATPALARPQRWDGGDDQPTSPLACGAGAAAAAAPSPMTAASRPTRPTRRARRSRVVDVPKLIGIGYFNATSKGIAGRRQGTRQRQGQDRRADRGQDRRADQVHRQLHHPRRRRHPVRRQRSRGDRAGAEEGAVEGHPRRRLRRQLDARRSRMVRQPGAVQRHRQGDDRLDGQGEPAKTAAFAHRHLHLHDAEPGALDRRDAGLCRQVPSEDEMAGDGRGAGGQHPVLQPGDDPHQQVWRQAQGPVRHDLGRDAGFRRSGDQGQARAARSRSSASPRRTR